MGGFFSSKKQTPSYETVYDPFKDIRGKLSEWLGGKIGQPAEQYGKEIVAPMAEGEQQSLEKLKTYAGQGLSPTTQLGQEEIRKTLTSEYDPSTSPYYQAVKAQAQKNLDEQVGDIASSAAGAGGYRTGARMALQNTARTDVTNQLNTLLGSMAETERQRRLDVLPQAMQYGQAETNLPLQQATALQTLGALPRTIQQAQNEAAYNEWLRATQQYPLDIAQLTAGIQQPPLYGQVTEEPSTFMKMFGEVSPFAGSYNTAKYGYNTNQASLSDMMNMLLKLQMMGG